ncbi:unnamed protein product [Phytomonas sp. Hart1]|nr:unnamed protein product [Phytomonas sp. Hart1]|eukprot:CCW71342.1 unnamed protein product [Phytomonas sp. isolate Hart1]
MYSSTNERIKWSSSRCVDFDCSNMSKAKVIKTFGLSIKNSIHTVPSTDVFNPHRLGSTLAGMSSSTASIITFNRTTGHLFARTTEADKKANKHSSNTIARIKDTHSFFSTPASINLLMATDLTFPNTMAKSELQLKSHLKCCKFNSKGNEEIPKASTESKESDDECDTTGDNERQEAQINLEEHGTHTYSFSVTRCMEEASQKKSSEGAISERDVNAYSPNVDSSVSSTRKSEEPCGGCPIPFNPNCISYLEDFVEEKRTPEITRIMNEASHLTVCEMLGNL